MPVAHPNEFPVETRRKDHKNFVCPACGLERHYLLVPNKLMPRSYHTESICRMCLAKAEYQFIKDIPLKDLPLYISYGWYYRYNEQRYLRRLSRLR